MKLFEIVQELRAITDTEDELSDETVARLDALQLSLESKVEGIRDVIAELDSNVAARKARIEQLQKMNEADENRKAWMKRYTLGCLVAAGVRKLKTKLVSCWIQANAPSAKFILPEGSEIPDGFRRTIPARVEPDLRAVLKHVEQTGECPEGFEIVQGESLRIK